jgi:hypothetical protein
LQGIDIARYLARLEESIGGRRFGQDIMQLAMDLASELKRELNQIENLATKAGQVPLLESYSFECQMWALAIITSAWSQWIFAAKSNDPKYRKDPQKREAAVNAQIARPYIRKAIESAITAGAEIGSNAQNDFRPERTVTIMHLTGTRHNKSGLIRHRRRHHATQPGTPRERRH